MTNDKGWRLPSRLALCLLAPALVMSPLALAAQGPGTENGQWTYLGGDAWHTRYTPADEITAENFDELTMLWRFDAGSFGPSTPRATPSYVDGKLIGVLDVPQTGNLQQWQEAKTKVTGAEGIHDLYFIFRGEREKELFRFSAWQFSR